MSIKRRTLIIIGLVAIAVATILIRLAAVRMYDLHIDEITYARFAQTIDSGQLPRDFDGQPFFLHPPGYFVMLAIWRAIFWHGGNIFTQYTLLRTMNIVLAGFTVLLVIALTKHITKSNKLGVLAGVLFAIDPFLIRQNTRSLMETSTMLFLLIGLWLFLRNIQKPAASRLSWLGIGLVFGLAIVTKDVALTFLVLTFGLMAIRKIGPDWRAFRFMLPAALFPYSVWLSIVAIDGFGGDFIGQKTAGIRRFFGLVQSTGFNAANAPSKSGTLLQTIPHYAPSYAIMGLGALAATWLLFSKNPNQRRWGCVGTAAALLLAYSYIGGTFEEQYLYYLMVPSIISVIVGAVELWRVIPVAFHRLMQTLAVTGVMAVMGFGVFSYVVNVAPPANGWQKTIEWVDNNVPADSPICVFGQGQFLLNGFNVCGWNTLPDIKSHHVQYIIISEKLTNLNYEPLNVDTYAKIKKSSTVAFKYNSPDSGTFDVLKLSQPALDATPTNPTIASATPTSPSANTVTKPASSPNSVESVNVLPNTGSSLSTALIVLGATVTAGASAAQMFFRRQQEKSYEVEVASYQLGNDIPPIVITPSNLANTILERDFS